MIRWIRKLIRRLLIVAFLLGLLSLAALYAIGKVPIHYALNLANVAIPHNLKLSGTLASGTMQAKDAFSSEPQTLQWQRQNLITWAITTQGPWTTGSMLAKPRPSGLLIEKINLRGNADPVQPYLFRFNIAPIMFDYQSHDMSVQISWAQPMILLTSGTLDIRNAQIAETQTWQLLGDYQAAFHATAKRTVASISSNADNGFAVAGKIGMDFAKSDQTPPTSELLIEGHFNNHNKRLLFPWTIPISGKKSAEGYPVNSSFTIPLDYRSLR